MTTTSEARSGVGAMLLRTGIRMELIAMLRAHGSSKPRLLVQQEHLQILQKFTHNDAHKLGSDLMLDVLDGLDSQFAAQPNATTRRYVQVRAGVRAIEKKLRSLLLGGIYAPWHQDKHFPDYSLADMQAKLDLLNQATGRLKGVVIKKAYPKIFRLESRL